MVRRIGRALLPADEESEARLLKIPERVPYKGKVTVPRQSKTHSTFFGVIADVCEHWPHGMEPEPEGDPELLRSYLLCAVGHRESYPIPLYTGCDEKERQKMMQFVDSMCQRARVKKEFPFIRPIVKGEPALAVHWAKSIDHDSMDEVEFRPIADRVYSKIYELTGIDVDDLIIEHKTKRKVAA